jgi:hypothetical protein
MPRSLYEKYEEKFAQHLGSLQQSVETHMGASVEELQGHRIRADEARALVVLILQDLYAQPAPVRTQILADLAKMQTVSARLSALE